MGEGHRSAVDWFERDTGQTYIFQDLYIIFRTYTYISGQDLHIYVYNPRHVGDSGTTTTFIKTESRWVQSPNTACLGESGAHPCTNVGINTDSLVMVLERAK